jgi:hypothetical protein
VSLVINLRSQSICAFALLLLETWKGRLKFVRASRARHHPEKIIGTKLTTGSNISQLRSSPPTAYPIHSLKKASVLNNQNARLHTLKNDFKAVLHAPLYVDILASQAERSPSKDITQQRHL